MTKAPAFQFYTGDWLKDPALQACSPATRGIWINLIACMWEAKPRGTVIGTMQEVARLANANLAQLKQFLIENSRHGFADVVNENGVVSISCRRMIREEKQREYERNKKREQRTVPEDVPTMSRSCPDNVPVPSSSSSSSSSSEGGGGDIPPHLSAFAEEARKIPGWAFTPGQETSFFEALLQDYPADVIRKATRDLHAYQLSESKPYKNPMRALRNWCAKEAEWRNERGEPDEKPEPAKDEKGNVLIPIGGELVPAPEFDRLLGEHAICKTAEGWRRKEVS